MKKLLSLFTIVFFGLSAYAQKTIHDPNVEVRNITGFHSIEVSGGIGLYLSEGTEAVAVSGKDEKVKSRIKTEVKNGVLKIYPEWNEGLKISINRNEKMKAYVSYKTLKSLSASGGAGVNVDGSINSSSFKLHVSGGSDFTGKVNADDMEIHQSGGADVNISGFAKNLKIDASGGSDLDGYELSSEVCTVDASGGSDVTITVNKEISAAASGGSDVNWKGAASVKKKNASGGGDVSHRS